MLSSGFPDKRPCGPARFGVYSEGMYCLFAVAFWLVSLVSSATFPVHGMVLAQPSTTHAIVRLDPVPLTQAGVTTAMPLAPAQRLHAGEEFDAIQAQGKLEAVTASQGYTAGLPDARNLTTLNLGDRLPPIQLLDQRGQVLRLDQAWLGKTVVLSFVFTRCPDALICPAISGKFAYLQDHLDAARTHLVEVSLDPAYDSPKVLAAYGARFGAIPERWSLVTGEQSQIGLLINRFGLSSLQSQPGNFVHDDTLAIISPDGIITTLIPTVGWTPDDVIATVLHQQGHESNPLRRLELAAIAGVISLCGGSTTTGQVMLDSIVFVAGVAVFGGILYLFARRIWG